MLSNYVFFNRYLKLNSHIFLFFLSTCFLVNSAFAADIIIDTNDSEKKPQLARLGGIPSRIDITSPQDADGISYNRFEQYDVGSQGIVINNSLVDDNSIERLGFIQPNKNLVKPAEVIIFEVTGKKRTELSGTTTILGNQAQFILVNPYGITCNGCSVVNANDVTLRTDKRHSVGGVIRKNVWEKDIYGDIHIGKNGISVKDSSLTLSSGKIRVNGEISAKKQVYVEAHADIDRVVDGTENAVDVSTIALITAQEVYLIATGKEANIKVSSPESLVVDTPVQDATKLSEKKVYIETKKGNITLSSNISVGTNTAFKFIGRNLNNQNVFKAKNIELELSGDFVNNDNGDIQVMDNWYSTSKSFTNYGKFNVGNTLQAKGEYFVNDNTDLHAVN